MLSNEVKAFWQGYLATLPADHSHQQAVYTSWAFGDNKRLQDELLALVLKGQKTATAEAVWVFEAEGEDIPQPGDLSVVLDGDARPACILETVSIQILPFKEVPAAFAYDEGEDDRTLASWRHEHEKYWRRTLPSIGHNFDDEMPVVCEHFRVIYRQ